MKNGSAGERRARDERRRDDGEIAAPVVRATPVTPAAADRSSGSTTAITYDWRVGHVHLAQAKRASRQSDRQRQRRHERHEDQQHVRRQVREDHRVDQADPGGDPRRRQRRHGGQQVRGEEDRAERRRLDAELEVEPVGHRLCGTKPPAKASSANRRRQPGDDPLRPAEAEAAARSRQAAAAAGRGGSTSAPRRDTAISEPDRRIADDDRAVGVDRRQPASISTWSRARRQRPDRRRHVAGEVVPGERRRPARVGRRLRSAPPARPRGTGRPRCRSG